MNITLIFRLKGQNTILSHHIVTVRSNQALRCFVYGSGGLFPQNRKHIIFSGFPTAAKGTFVPPAAVQTITVALVLSFIAFNPL